MPQLGRVLLSVSGREGDRETEVRDKMRGLMVTIANERPVAWKAFGALAIGALIGALVGVLVGRWSGLTGPLPTALQTVVTIAALGGLATGRLGDSDLDMGRLPILEKPERPQDTPVSSETRAPVWVLPALLHRDEAALRPRAAASGLGSTLALPPKPQVAG